MKVIPVNPYYDPHCMIGGVGMLLQANGYETAPRLIETHYSELFFFRYKPEGCAFDPYPDMFEEYKQMGIAIDVFPVSGVADICAQIDKSNIVLARSNVLPFDCSIGFDHYHAYVIHGYNLDKKELLISRCNPKHQAWISFDLFYKSFNDKSYTPRFYLIKVNQELFTSTSSIPAAKRFCRNCDLMYPQVGEHRGWLLGFKGMRTYYEQMKDNWITLVSKDVHFNLFNFNHLCNARERLANSLGTILPTSLADEIALDLQLGSKAWSTIRNLIARARFINDLNGYGRIMEKGLLLCDTEEQIFKRIVANLPA